MLFFVRFVVGLGDMLPPGKLRGRFFQRFDYIGCKQEVVAWHLAELKRLDPLFAISQFALKVSAAYDRAEAVGIGPDGPRYPGFFDPKEEARIHSEVLQMYRGTGDERMRRLAEAVREYPQERVDAVAQACTSALKPQKK